MSNGECGASRWQMLEGGAAVVAEDRGAACWPPGVLFSCRVSQQRQHRVPACRCLQVSWVGSTSLEVWIELYALTPAQGAGAAAAAAAAGDAGGSGRSGRGSSSWTGSGTAVRAVSSSASDTGSSASASTRVISDTGSSSSTSASDRGSSSSASSSGASAASEQWSYVGSARFLMVARRCPSAGQAATVPALEARSAGELRMQRQGEERQALRRQRRHASGLVPPPSAAESQLLYEVGYWVACSRRGSGVLCGAAAVLCCGCSDVAAMRVQ